VKNDEQITYVCFHKASFGNTTIAIRQIVAGVLGICSFEAIMSGQMIDMYEKDDTILFQLP
jgi:hypothetical protein